jgi:radical SAM superfamily enzyme YgiQ (UPF0313 family)
MILRLIIPKSKNAEKEPENWGGHFQSILFGVKKYSCAILSVATLAGLTPKDVDVVIQDENIEDIDFNANPDFVGITANTPLIDRAYEIADEFRKRKIKVIIGGVHASMLPDEALQHADSVLVGEAENIWEQVINDFKDAKLQRIYRDDRKPDLNLLPIPRYDLLNNKKYNFHVVQTTRGCPFDCEFCSVQTYLGTQYRCKPPQNIIKEVEYLNSLEKKLTLFSDDNFTANKKRSKEILKELTPLKTPYTIQARLDIYEDEELLDLLVSSGCLSVLVGFETINQKNIDDIGKRNKVDTYYKAIEKIQSKGLIILGSFIFGFDNDTVNVFEDTVNFVKQSGLGNCVVNILTPFPGTPLYSRLVNEDRLLKRPWTDFDCCHVCFKPKNMSPDELQEGYYWAFRELFKLNAVWDRLMSLYSFWNEHNARLHERLFPLITNLASHYIAESAPKHTNPASKGGAIV